MAASLPARDAPVGAAEPGARVITYRYRRVRHPFAGGAPSHPLSSPDVQILRARVDGEVGSWADAFTVICQVVDRSLLAERLALHPDDPRALLDQENGLRRIVGWQDEADNWIPGLANLTERQARWFLWAVAGFSHRQIAIWEGRREFGDVIPLDPNLVKQTIHKARLKLWALLAPHYPEFAAAALGEAV